MDEENKSGKNIQSVQRAVDILNCFDENRVELSLSELSMMLDVNKSTVHGIINTLHNNGYIRQNEERKYLLGPVLLGKQRYTASTIRSLMVSLAKPHMTNISNLHKATVNLFVVAQGSAVFSHQVIPTTAKYTLTHVSDYSPLYSTATGKLTLAHMAAEELEKYISSASLQAFSLYTITDKDKLRDNLKEIRAVGYSYENEELVEGVSAISVPIYDKSGNWVAAISAVDIAFHVSKGRAVLINDLKKASKEITQKLIY